MFHSYLQIRAAKNYVADLSEASFNYMLKELLDTLFLTHEVCLECLIEHTEKRELFGRILSRYFYETNVTHQLSRNFYVKTLNELFHTHGFYFFKSDHYREHDPIFFDELYPTPPAPFVELPVD